MGIPGVPNLLKNAPKAIGITLLGNLASKLMDYLFPGATWGIFKVGTSKPAVVVSNVAELDVSADARVSDYPIQDGSFTNYNKVRMPDVVSLRITKDGGEKERAVLLDWLNKNTSDTGLFDILTPERRYPSMTLAGYRIARSVRSGAAMIVADCLFQQVRQNPPVYSSSTVEKPEDKPAEPTVRVYAIPPDKPIQIGSVT